MAYASSCRLLVFTSITNWYAACVGCCMHAPMFFEAAATSLTTLGCGVQQAQARRSPGPQHVDSAATMHRDEQRGGHSQNTKKLTARYRYGLSNFR